MFYFTFKMGNVKFHTLYIYIYISANTHSAMTGYVSKAMFIFVGFVFNLKPFECHYSIIGINRICVLWGFGGRGWRKACTIETWCFGFWSTFKMFESLDNAP